MRDLDIIPLVGIISFWVGVIGVLFIALIFSLQRRKFLNKEIMLAIEKGIDIPFPQPRERNYNRLGLIFSLVGIIFALAMWVSAGFIGFLWGLLPLGLGIAFLLIARSEKKQD